MLIFFLHLLPQLPSLGNYLEFHQVSTYEKSTKHLPRESLGDSYNSASLGYITLFSLSTSLSREFAIVISMHDDRGTRVDFAFRCYIHFCTHFPNPFVLAAASCWLLLRNYHFHPVGKQTLLGTGSSLVQSLHTFRISTLLGVKASFFIGLLLVYFYF